MGPGKSYIEAMGNQNWQDGDEGTSLIISQHLDLFAHCTIYHIALQQRTTEYTLQQVLRKATAPAAHPQDYLDIKSLYLLPSTPF